ncbi:odorant receptor 131-2-like [Pangasianodon hypophthalmus]|uniref:odorant receptor 131-2-like n=1 Tax=Pangasianodon hypophthalmus TaxID=310915 RepID=UPI00230752A2|nr:odorant receptor 131-2-like [Pangasianodon hypophthalmus]
MISIVFVNLICKEVVLLCSGLSFTSVLLLSTILYYIMSVTNNSSVEILFVQQTFQVVLTEGPIMKVIFATLMSIFFIYLNAIMIYTLWSKSVFKETPRYILFTHMLLNDSIQLFFTSMLYIFSLSLLKLVTAACAFVVFVSVTTFRNAPLNLAVMSLERYVAICFPLRHAEIATQKRTHIAIGVIWFIGSINFVIDLLYVAVLDRNFLTSQILCVRERLFIKQWQADALQALSIFYFVLVSMIILFTYINIVITARSIPSNKDSAAKAHKTVLLHFIQLGLCLSSFLYSFIERAAALVVNSTLISDLRYLNYLFVLILPRCLSPLIYGLRDNAVRPLFIYYFWHATGKRRSTVNVH